MVIVGDKYVELIEKMIKEEKRIVKDVAIKEARDIQGVIVDDEGNVLELEEDGSEVFKNIYHRYRELGFGTVKLVIKKAISPILEENPELDVPEELRD